MSPVASLWLLLVIAFSRSRSIAIAGIEAALLPPAANSGADEKFNATHHGDVIVGRTEVSYSVVKTSTSESRAMAAGDTAAPSAHLPMTGRGRMHHLEMTTSRAAKVGDLDDLYATDSIGGTTPPLDDIVVTTMTPEDDTFLTTTVYSTESLMQQNKGGEFAALVAAGENAGSELQIGGMSDDATLYVTHIPSLSREDTDYVTETASFHGEFATQSIEISAYHELRNTTESRTPKGDNMRVKSSVQAKAEEHTSADEANRENIKTSVTHVSITTSSPQNHGRVEPSPTTDDRDENELVNKQQTEIPTRVDVDAAVVSNQSVSKLESSRDLTKLNLPSDATKDTQNSNAVTEIPMNYHTSKGLIVHVPVRERKRQGRIRIKIPTNRFGEDQYRYSTPPATGMGNRNASSAHATKEKKHKLSPTLLALLKNSKPKSKSSVLTPSKKPPAPTIEESSTLDGEPLQIHNKNNKMQSSTIPPTDVSFGRRMRPRKRPVPPVLPSANAEPAKASATLRRAARFFSSGSGMLPDFVSAVEPLERTNRAAQACAGPDACGTPNVRALIDSRRADEQSAARLATTPPPRGRTTMKRLRKLMLLTSTTRTTPKPITTVMASSTDLKITTASPQTEITSSATPAMETTHKKQAFTRTTLILPTISSFRKFRVLHHRQSTTESMIAAQ